MPRTRRRTKLEIPCQPSDTVEIHLLCRDSFGLAYDFTT